MATKAELDSALSRLRENDHYVKALVWAVSVIGSALIGLIAFIGYSFDARLSNIESTLMSASKQFANEQVTHEVTLVQKNRLD